MTVREFLGKLMVQPEAVAQAEAELREIQAEISYAMPTSPKEGSGGGSVSDVPPVLLRMEAAEERLRREKKKYTSMKKRAWKLFRTIEDPVTKNILKERYIWRWEWSKIIRAAGMSHRNVYKKHKDAMIELSGRFPAM